jgi:hypothetical protein
LFEKLRILYVTIIEKVMGQKKRKKEEKEEY